jgi:hypothetical protein
VTIELVVLTAAGREHYARHLTEYRQATPNSSSSIPHRDDPLVEQDNPKLNVAAGDKLSLPTPQLERMTKAPNAFPAWVLREALYELRDYRNGPPAPTEVLITVMEGDHGEPGRVLLVCPRPQCLVEDEICETDRAERWNELEYSQDTDGLVAHDSGGGNFAHTGFACRACGHPVTLPAELADDMDCV